MATSHPPGGHPLKPGTGPTGPHGEEVAGDFIPSGPTHDLGYEPDRFAVKTILTVPIAVIGTAFAAFVVTWLVFAYVFDPRKNVPPAEMQSAVKQNEAPLNERFGRISSTDPAAEVQQPRLEGLQKSKVYFRDGNPKNTHPSNVISSEFITTQPTREGNSPRLHAEDLWPERVPELNTYGEDKQAGTTRMPVNEAIRMAVGGGLLPAQPGARTLDVDPTWDRPKESNGGHGRAATPTNPAPSAKAGPDEKKGAEEKKVPEKK